MTSYSDLVAAYLADPGAETLAALRSAVRSAPNFRSDLALDRSVDPLIASGALDEAIAVLLDLLPGGIFSPGVHAALAEAYARTGRQDAADHETTLARAALGSIASTGDGTAERPWTVLRISDEYDVLRSMKKRPRRHEVVRDGVRYLDHHTCADGTEVYFDATDLLPHH